MKRGEILDPVKEKFPSFKWESPFYTATQYQIVIADNGAKKEYSPHIAILGYEFAPTPNSYPISLSKQRQLFPDGPSGEVLDIFSVDKKTGDTYLHQNISALLPFLTHSLPHTTQRTLPQQHLMWTW